MPMHSKTNFADLIAIDVERDNGMEEMDMSFSTMRSSTSQGGRTKRVTPNSRRRDGRVAASLKEGTASRRRRPPAKTKSRSVSAEKRTVKTMPERTRSRSSSPPQRSDTVKTSTSDCESRRLAASSKGGSTTRRRKPLARTKSRSLSPERRTSKSFPEGTQSRSLSPPKRKNKRSTTRSDLDSNKPRRQGRLADSSKGGSGRRRRKPLAQTKSRSLSPEPKSPKLLPEKASSHSLSPLQGTTTTTVDSVSRGRRRPSVRSSLNSRSSGHQSRSSFQQHRLSTPSLSLSSHGHTKSGSFAVRLGERTAGVSVRGSSEFLVSSSSPKEGRRRSRAVRSGKSPPGSSSPTLSQFIESPSRPQPRQMPLGLHDSMTQFESFAQVPVGRRKHRARIESANATLQALVQAIPDDLDQYNEETVQQSLEQEEEQKQKQNRKGRTEWKKAKHILTNMTKKWIPKQADLMLLATIPGKTKDESNTVKQGKGQTMYREMDTMADLASESIEMETVLQPAVATMAF